MRTWTTMRGMLRQSFQNRIFLASLETRMALSAMRTLKFCASKYLRPLVQISAHNRYYDTDVVFLPRMDIDICVHDAYDEGFGL